MRVLHQQESDVGRDAAAFAIGAMGGLAIGVALSRPAPRQKAAGLGRDLKERVREAGERARTAARRLQPARLRRMAIEQAELTALEDRVLDAFLSDSTLSERGIDVGAISPGIIELSGSVWSEPEAENAVRRANGVPGVRSVVNRMEIDAQYRGTGNGWSPDEPHADSRWTGRGSGMAPRRQGNETDPSRPDDSQPQREEALRDADRDQWAEEGLAAHGNARTGAAPEAQSARRSRFDEDELDNQDPHGKHGTRTLDAQPRELNSASRVGEGLKSGTHLQLEQSDVPSKPHDRAAGREGRAEQQ